MFEIDEDDKMYYRPAYKCGICGKEHSSVQERMNCEMKCIKKQEEEEKKVAEAKKKAEQSTRKKEVEDSIHNTLEIIKKYFNDYGYSDLEIELPDTDFHWPSKLWHYFF